jgi:hypothetical protein
MKMLKKLVFSLGFAFMTSCSVIEIEGGITDDLNLALKSENLGVLKLENKTYVFNNNTQKSISKFENQFKVSEFKYDENSLNLKEDSFENLRVKNNSFQITNSVTGEYIEILNLSENKEGVLSFDIRTSNGKTLKGFEYFSKNDTLTSSSNLRTQTCWLCWGVVLEALVESILDSLGDNFDSNCAKAISACGENGLAKIQIIDGWFQDSCIVECKS